MPERRATIEIKYKDFGARITVKNLKFRWDPEHRLWWKPVAEVTEFDEETLKNAGLVPTIMMMDTYNDKRINALASNMAANPAISHGLL
jgi:hypothetical protein